MALNNRNDFFRILAIAIIFATISLAFVYLDINAAEPLIVEPKPEPIVILPEVIEIESEVEFVEEMVNMEMQFVSSNKALSDDDMAINAEYIYVYLTDAGWSDNAIFALLGNAEHESYLNPGKWKNGKTGNGNSGYGLVQWTKAKNKILKFADENSMDPSHIETQLLYLLYEVETGDHWVSHKNHRQSFVEFTTDTEHSVEWLTASFYYNFEMANDGTLNKRTGHALKWREYFEDYRLE